MGNGDCARPVPAGFGYPIHSPAGLPARHADARIL